MKINGHEITGKKFAYDGCHKIYILEDMQDELEAFDSGYSEDDIIDIEEIEAVYISSCELRFISNWKLDKRYVSQSEYATFN